MTTTGAATSKILPSYWMGCFEQKKIPNFRLVEDSGSCDLSASAIALADSEQNTDRSFWSNNFRF